MYKLTYGLDCVAFDFVLLFNLIASPDSFPAGSASPKHSDLCPAGLGSFHCFLIGWRPFFFIAFHDAFNVLLFLLEDIHCMFLLCKFKVAAQHMKTIVCWRCSRLQSCKSSLIAAIVQVGGWVMCIYICV